MSRATDAGVRTVLRGRVTSGSGDGAGFVALPGYRSQFRETLGYDPFPGTFNVALDDEREFELDPEAAVEIEPWRDGDRTFGGADCYPVEVGDVAGHVVVPHRSHHPDDLLEILAPVELRDALDAADGDAVPVALLSA